LKEYNWEYVSVPVPVVDFIRTFSQKCSCTVYLNIYEGHDENKNSGLNFVKALEELNFPFTGADSRFYDPTREEMQAVAEAAQIPFVRGFRAETPGDLSRADALTYPLIVKHPHSFASAGLTKDSRVGNFDELTVQYRRISAEFGSARVEEFIEGRELSCLVVENADAPTLPFVYPPAEVQFPAGETFLHEELKWYDWDTYIVPLHDDTLARRIQDVSRKFFLALNGNGYARVDVRVRPDGEPLILEINPNWESYMVPTIAVTPICPFRGMWRVTKDFSTGYSALPFAGNNKGRRRQLMEVVPSSEPAQLISPP
jgi:D-alanine-D-alanine ligase